MWRKIAHRVSKFIPATIITALVGAALLGLAIMILSLLAGYPEEARNAAVIPIGAVPTVGLLIWIRQRGPLSFTRAQNVAAGLWVIASSTLAGYAATTVSPQLVSSVMASIPIGPLIFIATLYATDRFYRSGKERNISKASGKPADNPEVKSLARNHELATSVTLAALTTANLTTGLLDGDRVQLSTEAVRLLGITLGGTVGLLWFNFNPKQKEIREFIAYHRNQRKDK